MVNDPSPNLKFDVTTGGSVGGVIDATVGGCTGGAIGGVIGAAGETTVLFTLTGYLQAGLEDENGVVTQQLVGQAYETPGKGGRVAFQFNPGNLNVPAGSYEGEIEITFPAPNAGIQTVFSPLKFQVREQF